MILVFRGDSSILGVVPFTARRSAQPEGSPGGLAGAAEQLLPPEQLRAAILMLESISLLTTSSHVGCGGSRALGKHLGVRGSRQGLLVLLLQSKWGLDLPNAVAVLRLSAWCCFFLCLRSEHPNVFSHSYFCWFSTPAWRCWRRIL